MKNDQDPALNNRADHAGGHPRSTEQHPECCDDALVFGMRDNYQDFSMGITTILECLHAAECEGHVPELSNEWWYKIYRRYPSLQRLEPPIDTDD